jgi:hypothetical protein
MEAKSSNITKAYREMIKHWDRARVIWHRHHESRSFLASSFRLWTSQEVLSEMAGSGLPQASL